MNSINAPEFSRNFGFWNEAEQEAIRDSAVAIAGVGGDGYQLGLRLVANGVRMLDVADPEVFERENTNRVPGATQPNIGRKKVTTFREDALKINPDADIRVFDKGINEENIGEFMSRATLVFDETELTKLELGTMVAREARYRKIPDVLLMNVGFAAQVTSFHPESKHSFESLMGISKNMPLDEVAEQKLDLSRCVPYLPPYVDLNTLKAVNEGAPLPSIAQGVDQASAMGASQAFLHMVQKAGNNRPSPLWAPRMAWIDSLTMESGKTRHPRLSHYRYLASMIGHNYILKNHAASSFAAEDRERRAAAYIAEQAKAQAETY